ncbi:hypothetical protein M569_02719 [Genlisea aurea]|uniref:Uncharacterized protein n=1 Tax=Genlisea aurea TaxID=192259 RepID=S8D3Q2_9LAMI|nr:hypothetical protein M569_02719 [Genlisea aurea]
MGKEDEPPKKQTRSIMDPDYLTFLEGDTAMSIYDNHAVDSDEERKQQQQQHLNTGDCSPDVEIMECPPVLRVRSQHHKGSSSAEPAVNRHRRKNSKAIASLQSEFRNQIINLLVKPYDEREYQRLKFDISDRKPEVRHLDLRNGRERSCPKNIRGKCYLDYDPDLKEKLSEYRVDKPRCLNLMRGYFFWVQNVARMGSFQPWKDPECLAVRPARGVRYF